MSQKKELRERTCITCGLTFLVTAKEIKEHARDCSNKEANFYAIPKDNEQAAEQRVLDGTN